MIFLAAVVEQCEERHLHREPIPACSSNDAAFRGRKTGKERSMSHYQIRLVTVIMLLVGATNYADASPAGALGSAVAKKAGKEVASNLKEGWYCYPADGPIGPTCVKPR